MSGMAETMRTMHAVLRGESSASHGAQALRAPEVRVAAYQRFVKAHIDSVLVKNYTTFAALVGDEVWQDVIDGFFVGFPADDYELNASVSRFPEYVADLAQADRYGLSTFHVELVDFERREFEVYAAPVEIPEPAELADAQLNPTLQILQTRYPVGTFVRAFRAWQEGNGARPFVPDESAPETLFVFRHPGSLRHTFVVADEQALFAFKVVHDGLTVDQAATLAGVGTADVEAVLQRANEIGLVVLSQRLPPSRD